MIAGGFRELYIVWLGMFAGLGCGQPRAPVPVSSASAPAHESISAPFSSPHCQVSRAVLFGDDEGLLGRPQVTPSLQAGQVLGFRHDSIPSRSAFAACGIRSGDPGHLCEMEYAAA